MLSRSAGMLSRSAGMLSRSVYNTSYKLKSFKFSKIFAVFLLLLFLCADSFNSDVFAARKKGGKKGAGKSSRRSAGSSRGAKTSKKSGKSSRRSASSSKRSKKSGKSSRRSASSSRKSSRRSVSSSSRSSRRSASSSRSSRRSAAGRLSRRRSSFGASARGVKSARKNAVAKVTNTEEKEEEFETYGLEPCPLYKALWKNDDEERDGVYYKLRNSACYSMENTKVDDWMEDSKDDKGNKIVKAPWIQNGAVVLSCESGFLKTVKDKKSVCVDESSFCLLNEKAVLEKKGKRYFDVLNSEEDKEKECNLPAGSKAVKMTKDQLDAAGFEQNFKGFYLYCKSGYYSEENGIQCKKCPNFYTSDIGKNIGENSCKPTKDCEKEAGKGFIQSIETGECVKSPQLLEDEAISKCLEQKQGYDKETGKCKSCDDGFEPDGKGVCQMKQSEIRRRAIKGCYDKQPREGYDGKNCIKCNEGWEPNKVTGVCEETEEHKQQECFKKGQPYSRFKGCYDCAKGMEFKENKCIKTTETLRQEAIAACVVSGRGYDWDKDNQKDCVPCKKGEEEPNKDGRCAETFETKRQRGIENCKKRGLPYGWNNNDVTRCGDPCKDGFEIISGKCFKSKEKQEQEELEEKFKQAKNNKNHTSKWFLMLNITKTKDYELLNKGVYKIEVAGGAGGRGGNATVNKQGYGCRKTYNGGAGGKGQVISKVVLVNKSTNFSARIGKKGGDGGDKTVNNDEVWADSGADGETTVLNISGVDNVTAKGGNKGTGAWNDDNWCGKWGNSACSCGNGSAGGGYSNGNSGNGYIKIYEYRG